MGSVGLRLYKNIKPKKKVKKLVFFCVAVSLNARRSSEVFYMLMNVSFLLFETGKQSDVK